MKQPLKVQLVPLLFVVLPLVYPTVIGKDTLYYFNIVQLSRLVLWPNIAPHWENITERYILLFAGVEYSACLLGSTSP